MVERLGLAMTITTYIPDRRQTGDTSMQCDAREDGVRCAETHKLSDIGGDSVTCGGTTFVVKHRLCPRHRAQFVRTRVLIERC